MLSQTMYLQYHSVKIRNPILFEFTVMLTIADSSKTIFLHLVKDKDWLGILNIFLILIVNYQSQDHVLI